MKFDGYFHQVILTGKWCSKRQLKQKYLQAKERAEDIIDVPPVFCRLHNFEPLPIDCDSEVEFVIDTDTDWIYSPSYDS